MNQLKGQIKSIIAKKRFQWAKRDLGFHVLTFHGLIEKRKYPKLQRNFHTEAEFIELLKHIEKSRAKVFAPTEFEAGIRSGEVHKVKKVPLFH